jgi:hypothetical protein
MSFVSDLTGFLSATLVDGKALLDASVASLVAGVVVTAAASTAIFGFATFAEMRRNGRETAAAGAAVLAFVAMAVFAGVIAFGLYEIISA